MSSEVFVQWRHDARQVLAVYHLVGNWLAYIAHTRKLSGRV